MEDKKIINKLIENFEENDQELESARRGKKNKMLYKTGDNVVIGNEIFTIIYGPYEKNYIVKYEVEDAMGKISTVREKHIKGKK